MGVEVLLRLAQYALPAPHILQRRSWVSGPQILRESPSHSPRRDCGSGSRRVGRRRSLRSVSTGMGGRRDAGSALGGAVADVTNLLQGRRPLVHYKFRLWARMPNVHWELVDDG